MALDGPIDGTTPVENTEKPLFEVDLRPATNPFAPRSIEELSAWLDTEQRSWSWINAYSSTVNDIAARQYYNEPQIRSWIQEIIANPASDEVRNDRLQKIGTSLRERYLTFSAVHSTSPEFHYLNSISEKLLAAHALRIFQKLPAQNHSDLASAKGAFLAFAHEFGITELQPSFRPWIDNALSEIQVEHDHLRTEAGKLQDIFGNHSQQIADLQVAQAANFELATNERKEAFDLFVDAGKTELKNIAETYDKKLALQSAVSYLRTRARWHIGGAILWGLIAIAVGAAFAVAALSVGITLYGGEKLPWNRIAVGVLSATLIFWLLRIVVRIFLSNFHLSTDMRGRATMMETYLALVREGDALKDDDRKLILGILFRPTSDGLVRDDAAPAGPWDLITRFMGGVGK